MNEARTAEELGQEAAVRRTLEDFYRDGEPPWDSGITPPELVALVEGPGALRPGQALELGCGTGTNAVYLARHGWRVSAVDLVDRAVRQAREKAAAAGADVTVLCGDATRLDEVGAPGPYDLFFDLSCYCGIPPHRRDAYAMRPHRACRARCTTADVRVRARGVRRLMVRRHRGRTQCQVLRVAADRRDPRHEPGPDLLVHAAAHR